MSIFTREEKDRINQGYYKALDENEIRVSKIDPEEYFISWKAYADVGHWIVTFVKKQKVCGNWEKIDMPAVPNSALGYLNRFEFRPDYDK